MPRMTTFVSKETVKARKISDKDGEDVVTTNGTVHANKGDYVVETGGYGVAVMEKANFEERYKARSSGTKKAAAKPTAKK